MTEHIGDAGSRNAERIRELEELLETERLRLAACGVAALGYFKGCDDKYFSASLHNVLSLREKNKELEEELNLTEAQVSRWMDIADKEFKDRLEAETNLAISIEALNDLKTNPSIEIIQEALAKIQCT